VGFPRPENQVWHEKEVFVKIQETTLMIDKANYINYIVEDKSVVYSVLEYGIL